MIMIFDTFYVAEVNSEDELNSCLIDAVESKGFTRAYLAHGVTIIAAIDTETKKVSWKKAFEPERPYVIHNGNDIIWKRVVGIHAPYIRPLP